MLNKVISLLVVLVVIFFIGFFAGFLARGNGIKQETINAQEKKINNTMELKKEVLKVEKEIKRYEISCYDILNYDLRECLQ